MVLHTLYNAVLLLYSLLRQINNKGIEENANY
jgi:hypothetical protein